MTDLSTTIAPKSDQLNADDLIAGPRTIIITSVRGHDDPDQPISIHFEGDNRKPYKPCKSMRRVLVHCWGADGAAYAGRAMTLYRDERVTFGGIQVGGIRISHMSHIEREMTMALTATRAKRMPYSVKPLRPVEQRAPHAHRDNIRTQQDASNGGDPPPLAQRIEDWKRRLAAAPNMIKAKSIWAASANLRNDIDAADADTVPMTTQEMEQHFNARFEELERAEREANS